MAVAHPRPRVLIVDDEPGIRAMLAEYLGSFGYDIELASTAIGALGVVKVRRPDVILLDLAMPGAVRGDAIVLALSEDVPVIVMAAVMAVDAARGTLRDGAFDFVAKPLELQRVAGIVEAAIAHGRR